MASTNFKSRIRDRSWKTSKNGGVFDLLLLLVCFSKKDNCYQCKPAEALTWTTNGKETMVWTVDTLVLAAAKEACLTLGPTTQSHLCERWRSHRKWGLPSSYTTDHTSLPSLPQLTSTLFQTDPRLRSDPSAKREITPVCDRWSSVEPGRSGDQQLLRNMVDQHALCQQLLGIQWSGRILLSWCCSIERKRDSPSQLWLERLDRKGGNLPVGYR